jgi:glycosyltransferase involved in cell wall biosynthesis
MRNSLQSISIIIPVYNESSNLIPLYQALQPVLQPLSLRHQFTLLFVNDGSKDNSLTIIQHLAEIDPKVQWISLSRNFGKEIALTAGLDHTDGDAVILIDADLQHPPALISQFLDAWAAGFDGAYAQIENRPHESWLKTKLTHYFYQGLQYLSSVPIPPNAGDFRLLSRQMVNSIKSMRERHRYLKGLYAWVGFSQKAIPYTPQPRHAGTTTWSYWKLLNFGLEGVTSFSTTPLRWATYLGFLSACSAFLYAFYVIGKTVFFGEIVKGYPTLLIVILLLGGIQLITLGILGEYLGRMFNETKNRPLYFIKSASAVYGSSKLINHLSWGKKNCSTERELN